jgi:large subunit ribosomal protein L23
MSATKPQIKEAVEKLFAVNVKSVTTAVVKGKFKKMGRGAGYCPDWKKAFVRIADGQKIVKFGEA